MSGLACTTAEGVGTISILQGDGGVLTIVCVVGGSDGGSGDGGAGVQCGGEVCPAGDTCQLFYRDADADGYGDASGTLANGGAISGCTGSTPPPGYVANNGDCDDADNRVHPGQMAYFASPSAGTGTYDYNCSGAEEKETAEVPGGTCGFCTAEAPGVCTKNDTCSAAGEPSAFSCGLTLGSLCGPVVTEAFTSTVDCGQTGTRTTCGPCTTAGGSATTTSDSVQQRCH